jgi:hypothetical protein
MARGLRFVCLFGVFALLMPAPAVAQNTPLSQLLVNLIQADIRLEPPPPGFLNHEAHFLPGVDQTLAPYLFNQQLVAQLATFPIGSPTGGFSFTFDAASGTFQRATNSFGPSFADRALTNGRGKVTVGTNFQYSKYTSFEGTKLKDGDIKFYLKHADVPGDNFFEGDLIQAALKLSLSSATTTIFANYGVTDMFDLAVAVPIVHVSMEANVDATVLRLATGSVPSTVTIHTFPGGATTKSFASSGQANGIGDLLVRAKYRFASMQNGGLAASVDMRVPSGDADNLLGTGAAAATFTFIGSTAKGSLGPHFNVAYTATGKSDVANLANEFNYKVGTEIVSSPRATLAVDLLGRTLIDAGRLTRSDVQHNYRNLNNVPGSVTFQEYVAQSGSLNLLNAAVGGKFNVTRNLLINANVLLALNNAGVTARVTPVFGFDYTF